VLDWNDQVTRIPNWPSSDGLLSVSFQ